MASSTPSQGIPKVVVLDRDGVINADSADFIKSAAEWQPLPGSVEAIASLTRAGFRVFVASNQSGLGRGLFGRDDLEAIHRKMTQAVADAGGRLEGIYICPHHPDAECDCRKPRPGLLRQIEAAAGLSLQGAAVIGDSGRDLDAARAVGAWPILVLTGNGRDTQQHYPAMAEVTVFDDLAAAAAALIIDAD